jgi:tRNA threonylcarbamoyladenosine biosynthesis protein TsaB
MRILGFDTATRATAVAIIDTERGLELEARDDPAPGERPRHTSRLMPLIAELLERAGGGWDAIDRLAVGVGPGTFTGLRIGVVTARALARARELPLTRISTLRSLALNTAGTAQAGSAVAVIDARRGEAFATAWAVEQIERGEPLFAPAALGPRALGDALSALPAPVLAVGDGAVEFRGVLERSGATVPEVSSPLHRVSAVNHCRLAAGTVPTPPDDVFPDYLRVPDAELTRRKRQT